MIINRTELLIHAPIRDMLTEKHRDRGVSYGLVEVGYDIRLKQDVEFKWAKVATLNGIEWQMCAYVDGELQTGRFALASAIEEFEMPGHLMGVVHDKSSWARRGLSVLNTVIEPGWRGFLTLELVYHGCSQLVIPAGSGIAQVVFHQLAQHAVYEGKYQDQADEPVEAIMA
jgi:dCTP deaminase